MATQNEALLDCLQESIAGKYGDTVYCVASDLLSIFLKISSLKVSGFGSLYFVNRYTIFIFLVVKTGEHSSWIVTKQAVKANMLKYKEKHCTEINFSMSTILEMCASPKRRHWEVKIHILCKQFITLRTWFSCLEVRKWLSYEESFWLLTMSHFVLTGVYNTKMSVRYKQ